MPTVKIELASGKEMKTLVNIRDSVMDAVVEALKLPPDDRNIRIIEYPPTLFQMKPPYEMLIEISMFEGRTKETKKKLFQTIVNKLEVNGSIARETVLITINEQSMGNWGVRGGIPADEIDLGFNVKI